ncbi:HD domain-containing protein [bacterium]|nr:HD domain-containing protein [bacterium]
MTETIINDIKDYAKKQLNQVEASHSWNHTLRVFNNARKIQENEGGDKFLIFAGALLHDVTDEKLFEPVSAKANLIVFLQKILMTSAHIDSIIKLIESVSFGNEFNEKNVLTIEQKIVRDADRLDAIGAIGVARAFHYGGTKHREMFNEDYAPQNYKSKDHYRNSDSPTVNHFYEKLLLLKDRMETVTGSKIAHQRHLFMVQYLKQLYNDMNFEFKSTPFDLTKL